jgi:hypothetical protein
VASQPEARGDWRSATASPSQCSHVGSLPHMRRAPAAAQTRQNEQALPVERLCRFYSSSDMSGSVLVYVTQDFYIVNRACLPCSPVSIVSRNRSGAAKPR